MTDIPTCPQCAAIAHSPAPCAYPDGSADPVFAPGRCLMTADQTSAETGTDPRVDILAEHYVAPCPWEKASPLWRGEAREWARGLVARLDAARPSVVPGDTATEGGDVRERAREALNELRHLTECRCDEAWTARGRHQPADGCVQEYREDVDALAAAGLLAEDGDVTCDDCGQRVPLVVADHETADHYTCPISGRPSAGLLAPAGTEGEAEGLDRRERAIRMVRDRLHSDPGYYIGDREAAAAALLVVREYRRGLSEVENIRNIRNAIGDALGTAAPTRSLRLLRDVVRDLDAVAPRAVAPVGDIDRDKLAEAFMAEWRGAGYVNRAEGVPQPSMEACARIAADFALAALRAQQ